MIVQGFGQWFMISIVRRVLDECVANQHWAFTSLQLKTPPGITSTNPHSGPRVYQHPHITTPYTRLALRSARSYHGTKEGNPQSRYCINRRRASASHHPKATRKSPVVDSAFPRPRRSKPNVVIFGIQRCCSFPCR